MRSELGFDIHVSKGTLFERQFPSMGAQQAAIEGNWGQKRHWSWPEGLSGPSISRSSQKSTVHPHICKEKSETSYHRMARWKKDESLDFSARHEDLGRVTKRTHVSFSTILPNVSNPPCNVAHALNLPCMLRARL